MMNKKGNEINPVVFSGSLNTSYLEEDDLYIYKRPEIRHRFNVIGAGMIGEEHIKVTMLEGNAEIYGIYDVNANSIAHTCEVFRSLYQKELVVYSSLEECCNDCMVDGLIICTPNYSHIEIVKTAIESGKNILMEKPMVTTMEDAHRLTRMVKDYPAVFQIGLQYRYKAIYTAARKEVLESKSLGDVHTIAITEHRLPFLDKVGQWNKFSVYSGGTLVEKCCHYFDLFNLFAQSKPLYVYAVGGQDVNFLEFGKDGKTSDILDNAIVTVVYENGIKCVFNLCMFAPMFYEEITICGSKGRIKAYENENYIQADSLKTYFEMLVADNSYSIVSTPCYPKTIQESGHMGATYFEHKNFIENIEGRTTKTATMQDGFWSVAIGVAAEKSVKTGEKVWLKDIVNEK